MPQRWQIQVERLARHQLPLVIVRLNGPLGLDVQVALATSEPSSVLAPDVASAIRHELVHDRVPARGRGRRLVPGDVGLFVAPLLRIESIAIQAVDGAWIAIGSVTAVITNRPRALGVGGLLGLDILSRFSRIEYEIGPPDRLFVERDDQSAAG